MSNERYKGFFFLFPISKFSNFATGTHSDIWTAKTDHHVYFYSIMAYGILAWGNVKHPPVKQHFNWDSKGKSETLANTGKLSRVPLGLFLWNNFWYSCFLLKVFTVHWTVQLKQLQHTDANFSTYLSELAN